MSYHLNITRLRFVKHSTANVHCVGTETLILKMCLKKEVTLKLNTDSIT